MNKIYRYILCLVAFWMFASPNFASNRLLDVGVYYSRLAPDWVKLDAEHPFYLELHGLRAKEILDNEAVGKDAEKFVSIPLLNSAGSEVKSVSTTVQTGFVVVLEQLDISLLEQPDKSQMSQDALATWTAQFDAKRKVYLDAGMQAVPILDFAIPQTLGIAVAGFETEADARAYLTNRQLVGQVFQVMQAICILDGETDDVVAVLSPENKIWSIASRSAYHPKREVADGIISMRCSSSEDSVRYRGGFRITRGSSGHNNLVNRVELERYLYSVLPKEMGHLWPIEALKAQAVAARNYAVSPNSKFDKYGFDLDDSTSSQVYGGYDAERDTTTFAVDSTKGIYATSEGSIVPLFYHASSGGYIESTEEVWGAVNRYLLGKVDIYSTDYKWELDITSVQIADFLSTQGIDIGVVHGVEILERMPSGRVFRLLFHGSEGNVEVRAHRLTNYIGNNVMRSSLYSFDPDTKTGIFSEDVEAIIDKIGNGRNLPTTTVPTASEQSDSVPQKSYIKISELLGPTVSQKPPKMTKEQVDAAVQNNEKKDRDKNQDTIASLMPKYHRLPAQEHALFTNGTLRIYGHGYGHGIGMSQVGARRMALKGYTYDQILKFYYDGIEIVKDN